MVKLSMGNPSQSYIVDSKGPKAVALQVGTQKSVMAEGKTKLSQKINTSSISFESVLGSECRAWWEKLDVDHPLWKALVATEVDKIIFMPIFDLHEFERILQDLIMGYDGVGHQSFIQNA